jgi:hypothetical protein
MYTLHVRSQGPLDTIISLVSLRRFSFILGNGGLIPYDRLVDIRTDMKENRGFISYKRSSNT